MFTISEERPAYGMACRPLFFAFMLYERVVDSFRTGWKAFRHTIDCVLEKPSAH